ncbi:MAG: CHAT domain-containing protein [Chloroflexaceae bacterium]|nr:CHAT domain-containing protein [Chloroflexaceae bacterium]
MRSKYAFLGFIRRKARQSLCLLLFVSVLVTSANLSGAIPKPAMPDPADGVNLSNPAAVVPFLENKWEKDYETYFGVDFDTKAQTTEDIAAKLAQIQRGTGIRPAVLWMAPQPDRLRLVLIVPGKPPQMWDVFSAPQPLLAEAIADFNQQIADPSLGNAYLSRAQQLYRWIIAPVELTLQVERVDTLLLCMGAGLRSLPVAALHDGERFLLEKYNLTRIPAFKLTQITPTSVQNVQVLAMGASEFSEQGPLPAVAIELAAITPQQWPGRVMFNEQFTIANLQRQRQQQAYRIVHLATHAEFKSGQPEASYIQFYDRRLNLAEMPQLDWSDPPVDLLVLSACRTALGDPQAELGFAGLALQSGVKSAIASLWQVSDLGTMALMREFYGHLKKSRSKAAALREAQLDLLSGQVYVERGELRNARGSLPLPPELVANQFSNLSHPFYWAAFTLIGNPL